MYVDIREEDFDLSAEYQALSSECRGAGALILFVGKVRDLNLNVDSSVQALELSHYKGMTEATLEEIGAEAQQRWQLSGVRIIHRVGRLCAADQSVMVAVAAAHRAEAFLSAEFIMDELKTRAAFWKKEIREDGTHWLDMKQKDVDRAARWKQSSVDR